MVLLQQLICICSPVGAVAIKVVRVKAIRKRVVLVAVWVVIDHEMIWRGR